MHYTSQNGIHTVRTSIVIIDNRSSHMKSQDLDIIRPHYVDRFAKKSSPTSPDHTKTCQTTQHEPIVRQKQQKDTLNVQKSSRQNPLVIRIKQELLAMLKQSKEQQELELLVKKAAIDKQKVEHREIIEEITREMAILKKQIYQLYRHKCDNPKDKLCHTCENRQKAYFQEIVNYLTKDQANSKQFTALNSKGKDKVDECKRGLKNNTVNSYANINRQNTLDLQEYQNAKQQKHIVSSTNNKKKEPRRSERLSAFRINRKTDKLKTVRKKVPQNQHQESRQQSDLQPQTSKENKGTKRKSNKKYTAFCVLQNNLQTTKYVSSPNEQHDKHNLHNESSEMVTEEMMQNYNLKRQYRKSLVKIASEEQVGESQTHTVHKSKFYDLNHEQKNKKSAMNKEAGTNSSPSIKPYDRKGEETEIPKVVKQKPKQKVVSYQRRKNLKNSQFLMDLSDLQQSKNIEQQKVHREREEIEQLILEREKSMENAQPKLSRYQRERLIYGYLKKELIKMGCVEDSSDTPDYINCSNSESQASIDLEEGARNYSIKDRKHSLLSKLNIFNQSVNFEDMKTKIQTVIEEKEALGQNLIEYTHMVVNSKGRKEQKIAEKFLSEVLKINDLKRLLRKKFSKEQDWNPKMRQMHQFYTYLEFNLQNFRRNLSKNTENNWKQLAVEGKGQEFNMDELNITEDLGHYQGLENTEITQFQHHREIECSMKYYGIELKRLQQLQNFFYPPPQTPHQPPDKVGQKSLKQINQCDLCEGQD